MLAGGQLVIIMEYATDGDLREKRLAAKQEERRISSGVLAAWFRQTLLALQYIHGCRMVHRDLKSANVFISGNRILVGDFGISKVLESTLFATTCVGTPAYMAPEIIRNEKYTAGVDIWAFGVIAYEMLLLELPFNADSLLGLVYQIANMALKLPPAGRTSGLAQGDSVRTAPIHQSWHEMITACLNRDAQQRPSASQLLESVELLQERNCSGNVNPEVLADPVSPVNSPSMREFRSPIAETRNLLAASASKGSSSAVAAQQGGASTSPASPSQNKRPHLTSDQAYLASPQHSEGSSSRSPKSPKRAAEPPALPAFPSSFGGAGPGFPALNVNNFMAENLRPTASKDYNINVGDKNSAPGGERVSMVEQRPSAGVMSSSSSRANTNIKGSVVLSIDPTTTADHVVAAAGPLFPDVARPKTESRSPGGKATSRAEPEPDEDLRERSGRYRIREDQDEAFRQRLLRLREERGKIDASLLKEVLDESVRDISQLHAPSARSEAELRESAEVQAKIGIALWKRGIR
ncbi:unnamed protein product [Amoebophrya sp. A120]|nr:unnamed protein product [Amoebophrya sp. A120]|eukprot:GSA120T00021632001.1